MMRNINNKMSFLPHFAAGKITKGFGRGSKELGIPTANFPVEVVQNLPKEIDIGIYYGYASIDNGDVHKMVMSIGWNPYYHNKHKSMETHILHKYGRDLYGSLLKVCIIGYLRPEQNFDNLEALIAAIRKDIDDAEQLLESPENLKFKNHEFFQNRDNVIMNSDSSHKSEINGHKNGLCENGSHHNLKENNF
ncbi:hypothetical protein ACKWTF_007224 [Chironomus riparius]